MVQQPLYLSKKAVATWARLDEDEFTCGACLVCFICTFGILSAVIHYSVDTSDGELASWMFVGLAAAFHLLFVEGLIGYILQPRAWRKKLRLLEDHGYFHIDPRDVETARGAKPYRVAHIAESLATRR